MESLSPFATFLTFQVFLLIFCAFPQGMLDELEEFVLVVFVREVTLYLPISSVNDSLVVYPYYTIHHLTHMKHDSLFLKSC
jgi:hypothetical protein